MNKKQKTKLRKKALQLYKIYEALYYLLNFMTLGIKEDFEKTTTAITKMDESNLRNVINQISKEIRTYRKEYGIKVSDKKIIELAEKAKEAADDHMFWIPKYLYELYFPKYNSAFPDFNKLPEHTRIGLDMGKFRRTQGTIELHLAEASLFEDMCIFLNQALEANNNFNPKNYDKKSLKTLTSFKRATITNAFYLFEAYLNGVAFDFFVKNEESLDDKTKSILTEWDYQNNQARYLNFRDKVLKYCRIVTGSAHSPIQENNCPELSFILEKAKFIRDSIVHASPKLDLKTFDPIKEKVFFKLEMSDVEDIVDNVINLIKIIESIVYGNTDRLWWLAKRKDDGFFPESVFN